MFFISGDSLVLVVRMLAVFPVTVHFGGNISFVKLSLFVFPGVMEIPATYTAELLEFSVVFRLEFDDTRGRDAVKYELTDPWTENVTIRTANLHLGMFDLSWKHPGELCSKFITLLRSV